MSAPPPGYNPGDSLLQGGNAQIHPVQGGGGAAPEDQSLLSGGNSAEIVPVQGGGALEDILTEIDAELQRLGAEVQTPEIAAEIAKVQERKRRSQQIATWLTTPRADEPSPNVPERQQKGETGWAYWQRTGRVKDEAENPDDPFPAEEYLTNAFIKTLGAAPPPSGDPPPSTGDAAAQAGFQLGEEDLDRLITLVNSLGPIEPTESEAAATVRRQKALGSIEVQTSSLDLPTRISTSDFTKRLPNLVKTYVKKQEGLWKRKTVGTVTAPAAAQRITNERCPPLRSVSVTEMEAAATAEDLGGFDRLVTFLPKTLQRIFLYPAIKGDKALLGRCLAHIQTLSLNANDTLLFRAPLFGTFSDPNRAIFAALLNLKANSPAWVYFPPEHTSLNRLRGCQVDPNYERGAQIGADSIPNFLEPSYLVLSHPELTVNQQAKKGILFTTAKQGGTMLPQSKEDGGTRYASVDSLIKLGQDSGSFCIVTNLDVEDNSVKTMEVVSLRDEAAANPRIQVLYLSRTDKVNTVESILRDLPNQFRASRSISKQEAALSTKVITLGTKQYKIRDPGMEGVYDDWVRLEFTEDEAAFLMDMNLRPKILATIFKDETDPVTRLPLRWQEVLAGFLRNILDSNCYTDDTLLTVGECEQARRFVNRVMQYFMEHDAEISELSDKELDQLQKMLINRVDEADTMAQMRALEAEKERMRALTAESGEQGALGVADAAKRSATAYKGAVDAALAAINPGLAGAQSERSPFSDGVAYFEDDLPLDKPFFPDRINIKDLSKIGDTRPSRIKKDWPTIDAALTDLAATYPTFTFSK